jgi:hypothetical protein
MISSTVDGFAITLALERFQRRRDEVHSMNVFVKEFKKW